jgi:predicted PurR-regulated permease PerM
VGLDHWAFWTIALFALSFIPFVGVAIGSIGPALFAILQFPSLWPSVIVFVGIQLVAFVVGNLIWPKLQADKQNIDPCVGLLSIGVWSIIWGLPGAFLAVPLTLALIYQLAGIEKLQWIAILLSNDGDPLESAVPPAPPTPST